MTRASLTNLISCSFVPFPQVQDAIAALDMVARTPMWNATGGIVEGRHEPFGNTENTSITELQCAQNLAVDEEKRGRRGILPP